jgi:lipooligosaccharide transport system permease protein
VTTFVRKIEDFDIVMGLGVMPMFLFSGIFFPVSALPSIVQWVFQVVPLFHAVELLRALTTGRVSAAVIWHLMYLVLAGTAAFGFAMHRLERTLIK